MTKPAVRTSRLVARYREYLELSDSASFASMLNSFYKVDTLASMLSRGCAETRRAAALALSMVGDHRVIESLGYRLSDPDRGVRLMSDDALHAILVRATAPACHQQLLQVMHLNDGAEFAAALTPAMILAQQSPNYAEAHHQLAVAWMGLDDPASAECAYRDCLWQCRFHYLAWAGLAECRRALGDDYGALRHLRRAVAIYPDFESARLEARAIERSLNRRPPM